MTLKLNRRSLKYPDAQAEANVIRKLFALLTMLTVFFFVFTASSSASLMNCPSSNLCLWQDSLYDGSLWVYSPVNGAKWSYEEWHYVGASANDRTSSLWNNRVHVSFVSQNAFPPVEAGGISCLAPNDAYKDLAEWEWESDYNENANDSISGFFFIEDATSCGTDNGEFQPQMLEDFVPKSTTTSTTEGSSSGQPTG